MKYSSFSSDLFQWFGRETLCHYYGVNGRETLCYYYGVNGLPILHLEISNIGDLRAGASGAPLFSHALWNICDRVMTGFKIRLDRASHFSWPVVI